MPRLSLKGNVRRRLSQTPRRTIRLLSLTLLTLLTLGLVSFSIITHAQSGGAPANDNFANAQAVEGAIGADGVFSGMTTGTNIGATAENGEPVHACEGCSPRTDPASVLPCGTPSPLRLAGGRRSIISTEHNPAIAASTA